MDPVSLNNQNGYFVTVGTPQRQDDAALSSSAQQQNFSVEQTSKIPSFANDSSQQTVEPKLSYAYDKYLHLMVFTKTDQKTGRVIEQIPIEHVVEPVGGLINTKI